MSSYYSVYTIIVLTSSNIILLIIINISLLFRKYLTAFMVLTSLSLSSANQNFRYVSILIFFLSRGGKKQQINKRVSPVNGND